MREVQLSYQVRVKAAISIQRAWRKYSRKFFRGHLPSKRYHLHLLKGDEDHQKTTLHVLIRVRTIFESLLEATRQRFSTWADRATNDSIAYSDFWMNITQAIHQYSKEFTEQYLDIVQAREVLFLLLGDPFVSQFFPDAKHEAWVLEPPYMTLKFRAALTDELYDRLMSYIIEKGFQDGLFESEPFFQYVDHVNSVFHHRLQDELPKLLRMSRADQLRTVSPVLSKPVSERTLGNLTSSPRDSLSSLGSTPPLADVIS
eukprot:TRINITY_DN3095_c0_g1::TRINITY_DN3095_c0_g1_i1::g.22324::m.22324 TRINITY_DN3095_c0_g1::TRINITY_DN3095_c0_g1_i1::g.22324  ORF type:complete len:258 (-),score=9.78,DUF3810/PF12725.2/0.073,IQ/PF00612.22/0.06,IQ/PF00612.22/6.7e+02 TRINITY_DN3095_c0_g1_i1:380-1153(-)